MLLLADVFESFRKVCKEYSDLDSANYFFTPGVLWDSLLIMTGVKLELITNIDQHLFIENGLRGGISVITN